MWEKLLDEIRNGDTAIPTATNGIPQMALDAPVYELLQLMAAMTAGYNRNVRRINALRAIAKPMLDQEAK